MLKTHESFVALPSKTSQQVIIGLGRNWTTFYKSCKKYHKNNVHYTGRPKIPKFKDKNGRNVVRFDYMQGSFKDDNRYYFAIKKGSDKTNRPYIETKIAKDKFRLLEIIPCGNCYKISIVYTADDVDKLKNNNNYMAIDLGLNNFATCVNNIGLQPIVINGKILKSINQLYNKELAKYRGYIGRGGTSKNIQRISLKRNNIIETHMHRISTCIVNYCVKHNINTLVVGYNDDWKRYSNMGKKTNQKFVQIPHGKLIKMLEYKCENYGINFKTIDERYTSKSSFIDNDVLPKYFGEYYFSGKRTKRGLYISKKGIEINADVNGAYNILRKCNPKFRMNDRIEGVSFHPIRISV